MQVARCELPGGLLPAEEVKAEIVAAGGAVKEDGRDGEQSGQGDQQEKQPVARHGTRVAHVFRAV